MRKIKIKGRKKDADQGRVVGGADWWHAVLSWPVGWGWTRIWVYNSYSRFASNWIRTTYNQLKQG